MLPFTSSPAWHYRKEAAVPIVTGLDVAQALGLTSSTPQLDDVATVADQLLAVYVIAPTTGDAWPAPVTEAGIAVAIDVLQSRTAAGGQAVGFDGSPGPYRMGPALLAKVGGLLGPWLDQRSEVG